MPSPFHPSSRVAAYLRDSGGDEQEQSISRQERAIREWCESNELILSRIFADTRSGTSTAGRTGFLEMMTYFRQKDRPPEAGIVLWTYSRFAREINDSQYYKADLRRRGFIIHSLNDAVPDGLEGRLIESILEWKDASFSRDLGVHVKSGMEKMVRDFRAVPGTPPRGFKREPVDAGTHRNGEKRIVHRWVPDPEMTEIIRTAFRMRAKGSSYHEINQALHLYKSINCFPTFFSNRLYIGELVYGDLVIPDYCEPVIDQDTWKKVQDRNHKGFEYMSGDNPEHPQRRNSSFLLSGLLYCSCGSPMHGNLVQFKGKPPYYYYICSRRVRNRDCHSPRFGKETVEQMVLDNLRNNILTPENITRLVSENQDGLDERKRELEASLQAGRKALAAVKKKIGNLNDVIGEYGRNAPASTVANLVKLEDESGRISGQIMLLEDQLASEGADDLNQTLEDAAAAMILLDQEDINTRRMVLQSFIYKITLEKDGQMIRGRMEYYLPFKAKDGLGNPSSFMPTMWCPQRDTYHRNKYVSIIG